MQIEHPLPLPQIPVRGQGWFPEQIPVDGIKNQTGLVALADLMQTVQFLHAPAALPGVPRIGQEHHAHTLFPHDPFHAFPVGGLARTER